jgi:hypothetical protein
VVDVWVTNLDSQLATLASGFTYVLPPPTISGVSPTTGPIGGGTVVTITGANFQNSATVTFAGVAATSATVNSSTKIAATTPAHAAGTAAVNVTNPDNQSATLPGAFTYTSGSITAGCGAGTDNSDCGNVGDPYEGGSPPGGTPLNTCWGTSTPLVANTAYYLTTNVGSDATAVCFKLGGKGITLDLGGYSITGRIYSQYINGNGITIFNGTVNCNVATSGEACIKLSSGSAWTAKTRTHHLTVHNAYQPLGATGVMALYAEYATGQSGTNTALEIDHVTCAVDSAPLSWRSICLNLSLRGKFDIHNNDLTCPGDASACNTIQITEGVLAAVNGLVHNNKITLNTNTLPPAQSSARGLIISGIDQSTDGPTGNQVYSNLCTANNNRCFRFRQVKQTSLHDNSILNCASPKEGGCYTLGDPDNPLNSVYDLEMNIWNETIEMNGGKAFWIRNVDGITVLNSTVTGTSGKLGELLIWTPGTAAEATFCNIAGASSLDTDSTAAASTTVNIFNAGNWSGAGTINALSSCP